MPHDAARTRQILDYHLRRASDDAGPGSWEGQVVQVTTPDGRADLLAVVVPKRATEVVGPAVAVPLARPPDLEPRARAPDSDTMPTGRPREVAKALVDWLRRHPDSRHQEIMAAMVEAGYSDSATQDNLRVLVRMGLIAHPEKHGPYRVT